MFRLTCTIAILFFIQLSVWGQVGIKYSQLIPYGDIGEYFNKSTAIEPYIVLKEGRLSARISAIFSKCTSRIDTMPRYIVENGGSNSNGLVVPGYLVNKSLTFQLISGDFSYCFLRIKKKLLLYGGVGIVMGIVNTVYQEGYQSVVNTTSNTDKKSGGFKACGDATYKISSHVEISAEYTYNGLIGGTNTKFTNTLFSVGLSYNFRPFDD